MEMVPDDIRGLTNRWDRAGRPPQPPVRWNRESWKQQIRSYSLFFDSLPNPISRREVQQRASQSPKDERQAVEAFLISMVWGYGLTGYGPWRTRRVLEKNRDAGLRLLRAAREESSAGGESAYIRLARESRLTFLGPAFGTKYLHFISERPATELPLILDAVVSRALLNLAGVAISAKTWSPSSYQKYLGALRGWSAALSVPPPDLERILFASQQPIARAESWVHEKVLPEDPRETPPPVENTGE